jgi:ADP-ribose pyrophosphatase YjhB (NUDIX family)
MPIPEFIVELRTKIGHDLLWLPAVTAVVLDDDARVLLVRRADNGHWTLVTGCLDPGEQPAVGIVREIFEETGVTAIVERLLSVEATAPGVCANGDKVQWMDIGFRCRATGGTARVNDDESTDVGWFDPSRLPQSLSPFQSRQLAQALAPDGEPYFVNP